MDFLEVLYYFENIKFQENIETKRSTTFIKMQGDLYPCEVFISVLMDSSVNIDYLDDFYYIPTSIGEVSFFMVLFQSLLSN
jgi:hypothetical protein